jgi:hypothetical protein
MYAKCNHCKKRARNSLVWLPRTYEDAKQQYHTTVPQNQIVFCAAFSHAVITTLYFIIVVIGPNRHHTHQITAS